MAERLKAGGVILAAGGSSRFGRPKQLATFRGESLIRRATNAVLAAGCQPVVVVVGQEAAGIKVEVSGLDCVIVVNAEWREGIASSIRAGLQHLVQADHDLEAALLLACDQPLIEATALREMIELHATSGRAIVAAAYANTLGIPALFARSCFVALTELEGDRGAKDLIYAQRDEVAEFALPSAAFDIDSASDYDRLGSQQQ
jgi:molybdenum cofactor cytidylyltransferase